jgi:putative ABC transport system permease protein
MLSITLQDLRFRARQFVIAVAGAALVFAMTLLLSGLAAGFSYEVNQTVEGMQASNWIVSKGSAARVAALSPFPSFAEFLVAATPGVRQADPVVVIPQAANVASQTRSIVMVGMVPGGLGTPMVSSGHEVLTSGQAVVDQRLHLALGQTFTVSGHRFAVVGLVSGKTLLGGVPNVYVVLTDAQAVAFGGRPLVSAILVGGTVHGSPAGLTAVTNEQMESQSLAAMSSAVSSIENSRSFAWVIAAVIVAALVYVSALERTRDFAVLKALGSSSGMLFFGLATQAVLVSLVAAAIAAGIAHLMTGLFAQPVVIPASAYIVLPLSAVVVGLLSSLVALRRAISVDPAAAFAG